MEVKPPPLLLTAQRILLFAAMALLACAPVSWGKIGLGFQSPLGNPDAAVTDLASRTKYLIQRGQYHLSYNDDTHQANWVSWSITTNGLGTVGRTDAWAVEELLPTDEKFTDSNNNGAYDIGEPFVDSNGNGIWDSGFLRIGTSTFGTSFGIQWDRGHMAPSADRTQSLDDNRATFRMSNIIPQASANNQGLWAQFEDYCRALAQNNNEVLIISGPSQFTGNRIPNSMSVPGSVWKIAVVVPNAASPTPANERITTAARVIALLTPNVSEGLPTSGDRWKPYITSVEEIEEVTGLNFFTEVDPSTAIYLKNLVDTGTEPNNPTVITTFNPTLGAPGTRVTVSGYNFNADSTVQFNGVEAAAVTYNSPNELVATVPAGATSGPITADGPGGIDTSYEDFTVTTGSTTPALTVGRTSISGLTARQGAAGAPDFYGVNGTNLTASIVVTAPTNFEISADETNFYPSLTLTPAINGSLDTQLSVRIKSDAPVGAVSGSISHTSTGATAQSVAVSGTVISTSPQLSVSTASLTGFTALQGSAGPSKSYTVSGANLTGSVTITAPTGYEVSLDNNIFATAQTLTPVGGTLATTTVYARLSRAAPLGSNTGSITHSGGSASTQSVGVSGTVSTPGSGSSDIYWDFQTASATSGVPIDITVGSVSQGNNNGTTTLLSTTSASTGYTGASGNNNAAAAARTGALNTATSGSAYFEFTVTPTSGSTFTLTGVSFGSRSTSTGPQAYTVRSSADNFASDIASGALSNNSAWTLNTNAGLSQVYSSAVTLRIYGFGGSGSAGANTANWRIDDLKVSVSTSSSSAPAPVITVSGPAAAIALESFSYQITASNSPDSYAASGLPEGLTINTTTGLITGTPTTPGSYAVGLTASNAGGDGTATLTINVQTNPNAPSITSDLIANGQINTAFSYQITADKSATSYTAAGLPAGLSINTSTGLISGTPTTSGTFNATITALNDFGSDAETLQIIIRNPTLTLTPSTLQPFTADAGFHSTTQSYTLSGSQLTTGITVRAPQYFEISINGSTFAGEISLNPSGDGSISQTIIVRLANNAPPGLINGSISHIGSGTTPRYLEVSGTVNTSSPTLTLSTASLEPFTAASGVPSSIQTYEVSGASLTGQITITAPTGFEVGADEESFGPAVIMTPVNGALAATAIYVRLRDDAAEGNYGGSITHAGGGAITRNVAVTGTVTTPAGPNIIATSGGSAYVSTSYSYTIQTDGQQTVTTYGATGLPNGLNLNTSTGVISGTPTAAGTYNVTLSASSSQGTSTKPYTLRVITSSEQLNTPTVVINKYQNSTVDRVELLVTGDNVNGPPVDLRGMIIKDFNGNMATDGGGKYVFADHPLWSNVKAGTLIILAAGNTLSEDVDPSDFVLSVNLANPTYFSEASGGFDIGNTDMILIKSAGMQPDGVAGGIHALAMGTSGAQYRAYTGRKTTKGDPLTSSRTFSYVVNDSTSLADYYATEGADRAGNLTFGLGNNNRNRNFITNLRALDQDGPVITLQGSNPVNIQRGSTYSDAGATAFDVRDNQSKTVTSTGTVNTSEAGTYTITYTATDSRGNIGRATRTVNVLAPASTPPSVSSAAAGSIIATSATLNGNVNNAGTSAVTARGFVYSTMSMTLEIGADGVTTLSGGSGTGSFSVPAESLLPGTTYYFRAFATNEAGTSYGETLSFTTLKAEPLLHPAGFAAGTITSSRIAATWTATEADGFLLVVSSGAGSPPTDGVTVADDTDVSDGTGAINLAANITSYDGFTGFAAGQSYTFRIYAFNNSGSTIDYKTGSAPTFTAGVLTTPELSVSGTPAPLTTTYGTPSTAITFAVSGIYLTSTVSVTAPTGFEVSADNATFATSITLTPESGTLAATSVYLRLAATAPVNGTYDAQAITVSGGGAESVTLATAASGHTIEPKALGISGLVAADKTYDGTTGANVAGSPAYDGLVNSESFPVVGNVTWSFADKNVGANKVLVRAGNFEAPSANYSITTHPSLTASIASKEVTVTGASVTTKTYDTTAAATITGATLVGVVDGDMVTVSGGGSFNDANAGENKPVTANLALGGTDAGNYTLTQPALTGTITKADQMITFAELPGKNLGDAPFSLTGTANSGLTVAYTSSNPGVASVSGSTVNILSVGTTTITATQGGNGNYNAATPVARILTVTDAPTLIAGWDFQTTTTGGTAAATNNAPLLYQANFGSGSLHLDGAHGSSAWITSTNTTTNQVTGFSGTTINTAPGFATNTASPSALGLLGGASTSANSNSLVFKFDMSGRKNLGVSYATRGSSTGFTTHTWSVSTNASNWTQVSVQPGRNDTNYTAITLPVITNADNSANVYLRLTVIGATNNSGNNRIDNVQLVASALIPPDTTAPVITVLGDNPLVLPIGSSFTDPGATALDETDGAVDVSASGEVNTALPGDYTITYSATDAAGNTATATRTVTVIDITAPVITVAGDNPLYLPVGATFIEPGVSALDAIDGSVDIQTTGTVDTSTRGTYTLTYTASDAAGNEATATRTVIVRAGATHVFETQYGLSGANAGLAADADQDGVPNLMEYAFGNDPTSSADAPTSPELIFTGAAVRFTAIVRDNDNALSITPLVTSDLRSAWNDTVATEVTAFDQNNVPNGFRRRTWEVPGAEAASLFIRFEVGYE